MPSAGSPSTADDRLRPHDAAAARATLAERGQGERKGHRSALPVNEGLGIPADYGRRRGLPIQAEATVLVLVDTLPTGREIRLSPGTAAAWIRMRDAASSAGIALVPFSGFRSVERQTEIIRGRLSAGETIEAILRTVAAPGYSEHHTGRAVDIGVPGETPLTEGFERTPAFSWLQAHARAYGFSLSYPRENAHGIAYEPWHWYHNRHI